MGNQIAWGVGEGVEAAEAGEFEGLVACGRRASMRFSD